MATICVMSLLGQPATAQTQQTADKVIAVVGRNRIILRSELDVQTMQLKQQDPANYNDTMKCQLLQQMVLQKMLIEQAERDSVEVGDEEVDAQLDNRLRYFMQLYGSKERLEQASGKTIYQLKEDYRDNIKEQMLAERVQGTILQNVKITPAEVNTFYKQIPEDSLPFYPAMVEMGQIVINPPVSPELDAYARKELAGIRERILKGESFETMAGLYSQDPGSRDNGGDLGTMGRNDFVPEFSAAAFKLQDGEVSQVVKTKFGYHIIQMVRRQGDQAHLRHILLRPQLTSADFKGAMEKLDSVRAQLVSGKITFPEAVGKYATDDMSKRTGGMVTDPTTGSSEIEISRLDPAMVMMLDTLKVGAYSQPQVFYTETRDQAARIVYLKSKTAPHKANLQDDYSKIQEVALQQKKMLKMQDWVISKLPTFYLKIDPEYESCTVLRKWKQQMNAQK